MRRPVTGRKRQIKARSPKIAVPTRTMVDPSATASSMSPVMPIDSSRQDCVPGSPESVDSLDLAEKISRRAVARGITVGVLLEVNESGEASKSGCDPSHAIRIAQKIGTLDGLELQGLMTIGAHVDDETAIRKGFDPIR